MKYNIIIMIMLTGLFAEEKYKEHPIRPPIRSTVYSQCGTCGSACVDGGRAHSVEAREHGGEVARARAPRRGLGHR